MKYLLLANIVISLFAGFNRIRDSNQIKAGAEAAYRGKRYDQAIIFYEMLIQKYQMPGEPVYVNLAHAYYKTEDTTNAYRLYRMLLESPNPPVKSIAANQI